MAQPPGDMVQPYYRTLVRELEDTGFRVTPAPDKDIINLGDEIRPSSSKHSRRRKHPFTCLAQGQADVPMDWRWISCRCS